MPRTSLALRWITLMLGVGLLLNVSGVLGGRKKMGSEKQVVGAFADAGAPLPDATVSPLPRSGDCRSANATATRFDPNVRGSSDRPIPQREREIESALEGLAVDDPHRAMAIALGEIDSDRSEKLRRSVLRGWASAHPADAAAWVMARPDGEHHVALEAVFDGATRRPEEALALGVRLCAQDPTLAGDYGQLLVTALTKAGAYESAVRFAAAASSENSSAWSNTAFFQWASQEPEQALLSFEGISDPQRRLAAFQGIVAGLSENNPAAAVAFAVRSAPSGDAVQALRETLSQWVNRDPAAASEWLIRNDNPSPDLDASAAVVANLPSLISKKPEIAVAWAESIVEPVLRAETLLAVAREWALQDPGQVRRFINFTPGLSADAQLALSKGLDGNFSPTEVR